MKLIYDSVKFIGGPKYEDALYICGTCASACYGAKLPVDINGQEDFIRRRIQSKHESVIEHCGFTVEVISDRGYTHEQVRARLASYTQESTRYCAYDKGKYGSQLTLVIPSWTTNIEPQEIEKPEDLKGKIDEAEMIWLKSVYNDQQSYFALRKLGKTAQQARGTLPTSLAAKIFITMNFRSWRHFLDLRYFESTGPVQPEMKDVATKIWKLAVTKYPVFFEDLEND